MEAVTPAPYRVDLVAALRSTVAAAPATPRVILDGFTVSEGAEAALEWLTYTFSNAVLSDRLRSLRDFGHASWVERDDDTVVCIALR